MNKSNNDKFFFPFHGAADNERSIQVGRDEVVSSGDVYFGITDAKGRAIGATWTVCRVEYRLASAEESRYGYSRVRPGVYFTAKSTATRNGRGFGAYHYPSFHSTQQEAQAAAAKKVEASRKRYTKLAAKV